MNGFWGADVDALRTIGLLCLRRADLLDEIETTLSATIDRAEWTGEDADRFRADWSGAVRSGLQDRGIELRQHARRLAQHAEEQEIASLPDGRTGSWRGPTVLPGGMLRGDLREVGDRGDGGSAGGLDGAVEDLLRRVLATDEGRAALLGALLGGLLQGAPGGALGALLLRGLALGMALEELLGGLGFGPGLGNLIGEDGRRGDGGAADGADGTGTGGGAGDGTETPGGGAEASDAAGAGEASGGASAAGGSSGSGGSGAEGAGASEAAAAEGTAGGESAAGAESGRTSGTSTGLQGLVDGPGLSAGSQSAGRLVGEGEDAPGTLFERLLAMVAEMLDGAGGANGAGDGGTVGGAAAIGDGIGAGDLGAARR
jgi:hypothetical protein